MISSKSKSPFSPKIAATFAAATITTLFFVACQNPEPPATAYLTPEIKIQLPTPDPTTKLHCEQLLSISNNGNTNTLQTVLDIKNGRIHLIGLSPVGARLFRIEYSAETLNCEQLAILQGLPPATQILADIMLAYLPQKTWEPLLPKNWTLHDEPSHRSLRDASDTLIEEILYTPQTNIPAKSPPQNSPQNPTQNSPQNLTPTRIIHHRFNYEISIQNIPSE